MRPKTHRQGLIAYACCAGSFLLLDACWLSLMAERLYRPALGALLRPDFDLLAAALFYLLYIAGVVGFVVRPALASGRALAALGGGAAFGLVCYATYDLTNQATLRGWPWHVTLADLAWGSSATALAALVAFLVARRGSDPHQ
jgi:uncharacterized membrane protein